MPGETVAQIKERVGAIEFVNWVSYYETADESDFQIANLTYWVYMLQFILGGKPTKTPKDFLGRKLPNETATWMQDVEDERKRFPEMTEEEIETKRQAMIAYTEALFGHLDPSSPRYGETGPEEQHGR